MATPEYSTATDTDSFDVGETKVQHYGLLLKKPFGHKSARWQKRFFIVKEGFLLYYPESESKNFEKAHHFNIHPKGVLPLGGCMVEVGASGSQKHAIRITNSHFKGEIWVGTDSQQECDEWVQVLKEAGKVTWRNAQIGEKLVEDMEHKSEEMATEIKTAIDKLNEEASALETEKEKKVELETLAAKLEAEKTAIEEAAKSLREEKDTAKQELTNTLKAMEQIETEKASLSEKTEHLQATLESVAKEKEETQAELKERERLVQMQELTAQQLEKEKRKISDTALYLQQNLEQVSQEKSRSDSKWKEERKRRINTEKRLRLAEDSLKRLDAALRESGVHIDIQIETDVKNLRVFFEECIKEEQFEAQKGEIMKDAIRAKTTYTTEAERFSGDVPISPTSPTSPASPASPTTKTNGAMY